MSDASRALDMHEVGETPANSRSLPVRYKGTGTVTGPEVPDPPSSGTHVLTATDGVLSWEEQA